MEKTKLKILLVDDDKFLLDMYVLKLSQNNFEVYTLEDANDDFVDKTINIKPDLIFLDTMMPGRDGYEAIKLLKINSFTKDIPVIFFTNQNQTESINKAIDLGALDYLLKQNTIPVEVINTVLEYFKDPANYTERYKSYKKNLKEEKDTKFLTTDYKDTKLAISDRFVYAVGSIFFLFIGIFSIIGNENNNNSSGGLFAGIIIGIGGLALGTRVFGKTLFPNFKKNLVNFLRIFFSFVKNLLKIIFWPLLIIGLIWLIVALGPLWIIAIILLAILFVVMSK